MADMAALVAQLEALTPSNAAVTAAFAQAAQAPAAPIQQTPPCVLPPFPLNAANPHYTRSWFAQAEMVLRLHTQNDGEKVKMAMASLDPATFDKIRRALLPDDITQLDDFSKLRKTMIKLFDAEDSLFALRFAALQVEWGGPEKESVREYGARIKENMSSFDMANFGENKMATLNFVMGMKARALESLRTMCVDALRKNPKIPLKALEEMVAAAILTRQEQRLPEGNLSHVSFVQKSNTQRKPRHADGSSDDSNHDPCTACGGDHHRSSCRFKNAECRLCKKKGHIASVCRSQKKQEEVEVTVRSKNTTTPTRPSLNYVELPYSSLQIAAVATHPLPSRRMLNLVCDDIPLKGQLDTASDITIISKNDHQALGSPTLTEPGFNASLANGNDFWINGSFIGAINIRGQTKLLKLHVADSRSTLIGVDLFDAFKLGKIPLDELQCNMVMDNSAIHQDPFFKERMGKEEKKDIDARSKHNALLIADSSSVANGFLVSPSVKVQSARTSSTLPLVNALRPPIGQYPVTKMKFRRGDHVQWYDKQARSWIPGHITDNYGERYTIKSGINYAMIAESDVLAYKPSSSPAPLHAAPRKKQDDEV